MGCGCSGNPCSCVLTSGDGVTVTGSGTPTDPWSVSATGVDDGVEYGADGDQDLVQFPLEITSSSGFFNNNTPGTGGGTLLTLTSDGLNIESWSKPGLYLVQTQIIRVDGDGLLDCVIAYNADLNGLNAHIPYSPGQIDTTNGLDARSMPIVNPVGGSGPIWTASCDGVDFTELQLALTIQVLYMGQNRLS